MQIYVHKDQKNDYISKSVGDRPEREVAEVMI